MRAGAEDLLGELEKSDYVHAETLRSYRIIWHKWAILALIRKFKAYFLLVLSPSSRAIY